MDFEYSPKVKALQERVSAFMDEHVYPNEARFMEEAAGQDKKWSPTTPWVPTKVMEELKPKAKAGAKGKAAVEVEEVEADDADDWGIEGVDWEYEFVEEEEV